MEELQKWRFLRLACYGFAILTVVFAFQYKSFLVTPQQSPEEAGGYCGVVDRYEDMGTEAKTGRKLFKRLCASCHKLDKDFLGPALSGISERRDTVSLYQFIRDEDAYRKISNEIPLDTTMAHSHNFKQLSKEELDAILDYTWVVDFK